MASPILDQLQPSQICLLLIDLQRGFHTSSSWGGERSTPDLESNVTKLLATFRTKPAGADGRHPLIVHVQHISRHAGSALHPDHDNGESIKFLPCATPLENELVITKNVNSALVGTNLESILRERRIRWLIVAGLTTPHCVSTTVRMASNMKVVGETRYGSPSVARGDDPKDEAKYGRILLVEDATGMFDVNGPDGNPLLHAEKAHQVHLASLRDEFCDVYSTVDVEALLRSVGQRE